MKSILKNNFGISGKIIDFGEKIYNDVKPLINDIKQRARYNQIKVLSAFNEKRVESQHLTGTTGYGYDDAGREVTDKVFARVFGAEDALVRHNIVSGTHAISLCLFAVLRPGDNVVCAAGKPYDTLEAVLGLTGSNNGSLKDFGIKCKIADLSEGKVDNNNIMSTLDKNTKAVFIQKSKGYAWRDSLTNSQIEEIIKAVKAYNKDIVCIVDNCYGEFAEIDEPPARGADLVAGSLIKNPGGGIAPTGGYIAGRRDLVELASYKLNSVGLEKHVGATLDTNRLLLQGLFLAPNTVGEALSAAVFCAAVFKNLGFKVCPEINDYRSDIIQAIKFETEKRVIEFCKGIQKGSPVDSFVTPTPWDMPGYSHRVIMAAGGFVQGASIELSADAPIKPPYIAYMQGGLTFDSAYVGILSALQSLADAKVINL